MELGVLLGSSYVASDTIKSMVYWFTIAYGVLNLNYSLEADAEALATIGIRCSSK